MKHQAIRKLTLSAMLLAVGMLLPFLTGQIPEVGKMLMPMHLPVFLCGLICGWQYGAAVGCALPLLRSLCFGMPVFYPAAISMAAELLTYGLICGLLYGCFRRKNLLSLYLSLLAAMVAGRLVWGAAQLVLLGIRQTPFTWKMFLAGALLDAFPGILLQLFLIPAILLALGRAGVIAFGRAAPRREEKG